MYPLIQKAIGRRLRLLRGEMTQAKFAEILGTNQAMLSRYESGSVEAPRAILEKAADHAGTSLEWILLGQAEAPPAPERKVAEQKPPYPSRQAWTRLQAALGPGDEELLELISWLVGLWEGEETEVVASLKRLLEPHVPAELLDATRELRGRGQE